jgi:hypothetical protein
MPCRCNINDDAGGDANVLTLGDCHPRVGLAPGSGYDAGSLDVKQAGVCTQLSLAPPIANLPPALRKRPNRLP